MTNALNQLKLYQHLGTNQLANALRQKYNMRDSLLVIYMKANEYLFFLGLITQQVLITFTKGNIYFEKNFWKIFTFKLKQQASNVKIDFPCGKKKSD